MPYEKQNRPFAGLDELTHLPGENGIDKTLLWHKLELRLESKEKRSKALWYWATAAILLCIVSFSLLINNDQEVINASPSGLAKINDPLIPVAKDNFMVKNTLPITTKRKIVIAPSLEKQSFTTKKIIEPAVVMRSNKIVPAITPLITHDPAPVVDTPIAMNNIAVVKKKLAVVHNNELVQEDKQTEETINKVRSAYTKPNKAPKDQYAGTINLRIQLKN